MNYLTVSLVSDQPPVVSLGGPDATIPVVRFVGGMEVLLPTSMGPDEQARWCRGFAADLVELAGQIEHQNTPVAS
jgi:hypothetical protein